MTGFENDIFNFDAMNKSIEDIIKSDEYRVLRLLLTDNYHGYSENLLNDNK